MRTMTRNNILTVVSFLVLGGCVVGPDAAPRPSLVAPVFRRPPGPVLGAFALPALCWCSLSSGVGAGRAPEKKT